MFESRQHFERITEQRNGWYVWDVQFPPFIVRRCGIVVDGREHGNPAKIGDVVEQQVGEKR